MSKREVVPGWTVHTYEAFGPKNVTVDVNDDDTITIEHYVPSDYFSHSEVTARVTVPVRWLTEAIAAVLTYRALKRDEH